MSKVGIMATVSALAGLAYGVFFAVIRQRVKRMARRNGRLGYADTRRLAIQMSVAVCLFWVFGLGPFVLLGELPFLAVLLPLPAIALLGVGQAHYWAAWYKVR